MSIVAISQDSFYRDLEPEDLELAHKSEYNFDHPKSIDDSAIYELLIDLCEGRPGKIPIYDFKVYFLTRQKYTVTRLPRLTEVLANSSQSSQPKLSCSRGSCYFITRKSERFAT